MNTEDIWIVGAKRTPFGRFLGALAAHSPVDLAVAAGRAALGSMDRERVDLCLLGNVLSAGQGMNMARQLALALELPVATPAFTINQMCASGLTAVLQGVQAIRAGEARVVVCGGAESMSQAPRLLCDGRGGKKLGDQTLVDSLLRDGLVDPSGEHMGITAERLATRFQISREAQDAYAARSHRRAAAGQADAFPERIDLKELAHDEQVRPDTTVERLARLPAVFSRDGTVTAANASGINDGAAVLVLAAAATAREEGWAPLARVTGWATVGCDPLTMGLGPVFAARKLCARFGFRPDRFDAVEINEAFAAQVLACLAELEVGEPERVNLHGGAIALGHPIGASGARLAAHLAHRIASGRAASALGALCVGGGMGIAIALEAA